jgi:hypothetical protein
MAAVPTTTQSKRPAQSTATQRVATQRAATQREATKRGATKRGAKKITCEDCFFHANLLCALELNEPCSTFRPNEAQLRPPQQLRFVFRQERRSRAAWAFPSAQEQAALHA